MELYFRHRTMSMAIILALYMTRFDTPIPVWTPSRGFRIFRYPLHRMFSVLISILINWGICAALTAVGAFTDDPDNVQYNARTDGRAEVIYKFPWFTIPYPGQYGAFGISTGAIVCFMMGTLISVLDSIGDYYAVAKVSRVPPPPTHAMNRGILIEGICSFLAGTIGCGHATASYGGHIGLIGVTRVASRRVFVACGMFHLLFGLFGKFSAIFITIPYPVLGGAIMVSYGIFLGVTLSNLHSVPLTSSRNAAILGISIFVGFLVPTWILKTEDPINTGTREERGLAAWHVSDEEQNTEVDKNVFNAGYEVYIPPFVGRLSRHRFMKYVPFLPYKRQRN